MSNKNIIIFVVLAIVLVVAAYFFFQSSGLNSSSESLSLPPVSTPSPTGEFSTDYSALETTTKKPLETATQTQTENTTTKYTSTSSMETPKVIIYTDSGYSPNTLKIKVGESVTFKNQSSQAMWPASAMHPSHTVYSGTSLVEHCPDTAGIAFDACTSIQPGNSWSFTFNKKGSWRYHDHLIPSFTGTIIVE
ncbi:MAG: hypothetical protein KatS3mg097_528 [Candidatus Parcubacteria bacterium]|nr:MAG: hypothetical protein KatS3mg097_528 [Candidatus Parcubacteria bacterium]